MLLRPRMRFARARLTEPTDNVIIPLTLCHHWPDACLVAPQVEVREDEGVRPGTSVAKLSKLRPSFTEDGTTTAGNSSQVHNSRRTKHGITWRSHKRLEWSWREGVGGRGRRCGERGGCGGFLGPRPRVDADFCGEMPA